MSLSPTKIKEGFKNEKVNERRMRDPLPVEDGKIGLGLSRSPATTTSGEEKEWEEVKKLNEAVSMSLGRCCAFTSNLA